MRHHSSRCGRCRRMKVKCDGQTPACGRCANAGKECPGYPEPVFISMNSASEHRALRLRFKRTKRDESPEPQGRSSSAGTTTRGNSPPNATVVPPKLFPSDWVDQALCFFISKYTIQPAVPWFSAGYLEFLPALCAEGSVSSAILRKAVAAASLAAFSAHTAMPELMIQARKEYGGCLGLLRMALGTFEGTHSDSTLLTLYILSKYEIITADKPTLWETHVAGQVQLIKVRGHRVLDSPVGHRLYRMMYVRQQMRDIADRQMPTVFLMSGVGARSLFPAGLGFQMIHNFTTITCVIARAQRLFDQVPLPETCSATLNKDLLSSYKDALDLDRDLESWNRTAAKMIPFATLGDKYTAEIPAYYIGSATPDFLLLFVSFHHTMIWARLWSGRVYLLQVLREHVAILKARGLMPADEPVEAAFERSMLDMIDNICASLPYALSDVDELGKAREQDQWTLLGPWVMLWFMELVASTDIISEERFAWMCRRLEIIGHTTARQGLVIKDHCEALRRTFRAKRAEASPAPTRDAQQPA